MKLCSWYHQGLYTWTQALRTLFLYKEFTKKRVLGTTQSADPWVWPNRKESNGGPPTCCTRVDNMQNTIIVNI